MVTESLTDEKILIEDDIRWNLLQRKTAELRAQQAFSLFRQHSIEPILIKGFAAAQFYPESILRHSIDMDLAVSDRDFEAATVISNSAEANGLAIDLHRELRHLDTARWDDLFENSRLLRLDNGSIRVLRPEDHLRVLCVHWLTDGGTNKDRLWDIYYLIKNCPADFDWKRFLNTVDNKRRRWLTCTVGLASRYLDLDLTGTPVSDAADKLPQWLIFAVEREWASTTRLLPLHVCLNDPRLLIRQILKRLRPNPIWATVEMEGSFDAKTRIFYQVGSIFKRLMPSYRRIAATVAASRFT